MSDAEKPTPESPNAGTSEAAGAPSGSSANVISIEQARAELLGRPKRRPTPPKGTEAPDVRSSPRSVRSREVPMPVTLPPGEHSAVIVTDTPAARAHIDKKTVHPGEAPPQTHDKKVRVKTHLDPRRAKTSISDRRGSVAPPGEGDVASLWNGQPPSTPPPATASQPPPALGSQRTSLARSRPIPRETNRGSPLFLIGVVLAAALGAVVVFLLSRGKTEPLGPPPGTTEAQLTGVTPGTSGASSSTGATGATAPATTSAATTAATTSEPATTAQVPAEIPSAIPATPKTAHSLAPKASGAPSATTTASSKPTATSILPFGKEEN